MRDVHALKAQAERFIHLRDGSQSAGLVRDLLAELARLDERVEHWRSWAQFIWLGGGAPVGTDKELQRRACEASDQGRVKP